MLLANIEFSAEGIGVIGLLLSTVVGALVFTHRLLMKSKDDHVDFMKIQYEDRLKEKDRLLEMEKHNTNSYQQIAVEVLKVAEKELKPKLKPALATVIPESSSPPTAEQRVTANIADMRARAVAVTLASSISNETLPPESVEKLLGELAQVKVEVSEKLPEKVADKVVEKIKEKQ